MSRKSRLRALGLALLVAIMGALLVINLLHLAPAVLTRTTPLVPQAELPTVSAAPAGAGTVGTSSAGAPAGVTAAQVQAAVDQVFAGLPSGSGAFTGTVVDAASGTVLATRAGETLGVPASSLKTLTAAAALSVLGADTTVTTSVMRARDAVVLVGGGDVLLTPEGLAALAGDVAAVLKESDDAAPVQVVLDDTLFAGATLSPHWHESLMTSNNIAPVMPLAMYAAHTEPQKTAPRVADPAMTAAQEFRDALAEALGAERVAAEVLRGDAEGTTETLAELRSPTVAQMVRVMTEESENYVAEALGRLVAIELGQPASFGGVAQALTAVLGRMGVEADGVSLVDASGLAAANKISPQALALMLAAATTAGEPALRDLSYMLPIAGATGTMSGRLGGDATLGRVRAKTGTLAGVVTLTGTALTSDGQVLAFSFFAAGVPDLGTARKQLDAAAAALAGL